MGTSGSHRSKFSSTLSLGHGRKRHSFDFAESEWEPKSASSASSNPGRPDDDDRKHDKKKRKITREDIAEYKAKKAQKKLAKVAKKFNVHAKDSNLNEIFVWKKKIDRDIARGVPLENFSLRAEKKRKREIIAEIEKVKKRREQRAIEKAQREEEKALLGRERARAEFQDWQKKEAEFHLDQSKIRSEIRLREGRMKPIDVLVNYLHPSNDLGIEKNEPYMVLKGLKVEEIEELQEEIRLRLDFDKEMTMYKQYWETLLVLCDWKLAEVRVEERGMNSSIETEVKNLLQGQTYGELEALQSKIEGWMWSGAAKVVEYWEAVLKRLPVFKAKAFLKDVHARLLHEQLQHLEKSLEVEDAEAVFSSKCDGECTLERRHSREIALRPAPSEDNFEKKALRAMGEMEEGDSIFGLKDEISIDSQVQWWHDKYSPRRPKYFNRVHTAYEWNRYNQTHYGHENPPPKTVQGYKFNIFYPELVDKSKAPTYIIEKDGDSTETCIIRFYAAAPYEDIAFRIVNKEWEFSRKKGLKCTFECGILRLYFTLKRYRYRR